MGYSTEVIQRARERLARAKADRESQNHAHLDEAYRKVPRLREIDRQLRMTVAQAAAAVFSSGGDVQAAMNEVKEQNLALQREREELIAENFEKGYLDDKPICELCGGRGYIGSSMCRCLTELCRQEQRKELTMLGNGTEDFSQFRLDFYPDRLDPNLKVNIRSVMEKTFEICKKYAFTFSVNSGNLLFSGDTGLGKTFLSACIARTVADRGFSVVYESAPQMFGKCERAKFNNDEQARHETERYDDCDLLIIDDLGTELAGQFTTSMLYAIINGRIQNEKPTIISTNLNSADLAQRYSPQVSSRLRGCYTRLAFLGNDIRILKNRGY